MAGLLVALPGKDPDVIRSEHPSLLEGSSACRTMRSDSLANALLTCCESLALPAVCHTGAAVLDRTSQTHSAAINDKALVFVR
jgi:hypothetical protein